MPRTAEGRVDIDALARAAHRVSGHRVLLESVPGTPGTGRWSYVVVGVSGRLTWWPDRGLATSGVADGLSAGQPLDALAAACDRLGLSPHDGGPADDEPPFRGGLVGGFSYDLARSIEAVPERAAADRDLPWFDLFVANEVLAVDHASEEVLLVGAAHPRTSGLAGAVRDALADSVAPRPTALIAGAGHAATTSLPRGSYTAAVRSILEHIAAGDTFQVNLSQRLTAPWGDDAHALYQALRAASPAPYGAIVPAGEAEVASISPETFLHVDRGRVTVRPIKGTRKRSPDPERDTELREELAASEKDRAENVMVVDMERNDLGRVCVPGSVHVPELCAVEGHPTVWHLVSTVTGDLRPDAGYADLLRATFPCGSVTGTPKVRALGLIDAHEPVRRGWYCGALGFLGDGAASLSVAIRTATLLPDGRADYGAGGGIVADSSPDAEHEESLAKAAAFLAAVHATAPGS